MNGTARNGQLPDCRRVAVDSVARKISRLDAEVSALVRAAAALWHRRALGLSVVPVDRVRASTAAPVEPTGQGGLLFCGHYVVKHYRLIAVRRWATKEQAMADIYFPRGR